MLRRARHGETPLTKFPYGTFELADKLDDLNVPRLFYFVHNTGAGKHYFKSGNTNPRHPLRNIS